MHGFLVFEGLRFEAIDSAEVDNHRMFGAIATKPNISRNRLIAVRDFDPFNEAAEVAPGPFIELQAFAEALHLAWSMGCRIPAGGIVGIGLQDDGAGLLNVPSCSCLAPVSS